MKDFKEFIEQGIVKTQSPDLSRANSLIKESEKNYFFLKQILEKISLSNENANSVIVSCYDIIMKRIRANMLRKGLNASGYGAHEAGVYYLQKVGFSQNEVEFADQLRYFRNGIEYYGKSFDKIYAQQVLDFLEKIRSKT